MYLLLLISISRYLQLLNYNFRCQVRSIIQDLQKKNGATTLHIVSVGLFLILNEFYLKHKLLIKNLTISLKAQGLCI